MKLNLVEALSDKEPIGGLEVSDEFLRLVLLGKTRGAKLTFVKEAVEEPLPAGVVESGILKNEEAFITALKSLIGKTKWHVKNVVVSLSDLNAYSKIFSFPKTLPGGKINDAMKVTAGFNLPVKIEDVYLDWETIPSEKDNEVYLALIPKNIVDPFLKSIEKAGLNPFIVETHILSLVRGIALDDKLTTLVIVKGKSYSGFIVMKGKSLKFSRMINRLMTDADLDAEIKKISDFYEVSDESIKKFVDLSELPMAKKFAGDPKLAGDPKSWLIALGAALRGLLPRAEDNLISLTSVGTEVAYEIQKDTLFAKFISDAIAAISAVIAIAFVLVWILMLSLQSRSIHTASSTSPLPQNGSDLEPKVAKFNTMVAAVKAVIDRSPNWSIFFDELRTKITPGITINNFSAAGTQSAISISGSAVTRIQLANFKKSLDTSTMWTVAPIPPTDLEKTTNISFSASITLKDPSMLTPK